VVAGVVAAGLIAGVTAVAVANASDDAPITGATRDRAVAAALRHVGGGTVTETEVGDGGAAYGVEVRLDDGSQVELQLDASFHVIGSEADDDGARDGDPGGAGDD
jgi:uncharacterized membrane protein YkoI